MAEPITLESFLECVRKSKLLDPDRLRSYLDLVRNSDAREPAPTELARRMEKDGLLTSFQIRFLLQGHSRGLILANKYKVLDLLGAGGVGRVYLAEHMVLRRLVAIKILPPASAEVPGVIERFHREARAVASFNDPNILQVFDVDRSGKLHFMVMEYVEGKTLQDMVSQSGPMDILHACHYIRQGALGLQHAHEHGWVHRDIKPSNMLVDRRKMVKILDLGLARFFHDNQDNLTLQHNEKIVLGTADYIAPEQAIATHAVDARADIYGLGATFYCLLAGRPPFHEGTIQQKLIWHQMRDPVPLTQIRPDVPPALAALIERMMAKKPEDRFQTAAEVYDALDPFCQDPLPLDPGSSIRTTRQVPRLPRTVGAASPGTPLPTEPALRQSSGTDSTVASGSRGREEGNSTPVHSLAPMPGLRTGTSGVSTPPLRARTRAWLATRWGQMALLGAAVFLLSTGGMFLIGKYFHSPAPVKDNSNDPKPDTPEAVAQALLTSTGRNTLVVCTDPELARALGAHHRRTLREALQGAQTGDVIRVVGDLTSGVEDHLVLNAELALGHLTLEGFHATGKPGLVAWKTGGAVSDQPLLSIKELRGLTVRNFAFQGNGRLDTLVEISGACPGVKLEDSQLEEAKGPALVLQEAQGTREEGIALRRVRLLAPARPKRSAGVLLRGGTDRRLAEILVADCRFEGPFEAALSLEGPVDYLDLRQNRFYKVEAGLVFRKAEPPPTYRVTLTNNTFYEVGSALLFRQVPAEGKEAGRGLRLRNNLFVKTSALMGPLVLDGTRLQAGHVKEWFTTLEGNIRDPQSGEKGVPLGGVDQKYCEGIMTDPANPRFLRYPANSPLWKAGAQGAPVGSVEAGFRPEG
jgi:serine/threonine protein kinase